jgi:hypothetical protein
MRCAWLILLGFSGLLAGCQSQPARPPVSPRGKPAPKIEVTPDTALTGKVKSANLNARFVILSFPIGQMPRVGQPLLVYRQGLQVGEVRITGPQMDCNIAADLVAGEAMVGDEVREH